MTRALLVLLAAIVWGQAFPAAQGSDVDRDALRGQEESGISDCQGLPAIPGLPEVRRALVDPSARFGGSAPKQVGCPTGSSRNGGRDAKPHGLRLAASDLEFTPEFQTHLRTNGSADAHGSRA
ncbi:MAG TPA: hypothetical protein VK843_20895 [Planctomycetota bacterium]|nr:hypothetical protein [Planctomycetota bacterium]